jgi:putative oxidoreductase
LLIRTILAVVFVYHGGQKLFGAFGGPGIAGFAGYLETLGVPLPTLNATLAGSAEFFGGLALLSGVASRLASVPLVITMLVASFTAHSGFDLRSGGMEYPLTLGVVALGLGLIGPGNLTLPHLLRRLAGPKPAAERALVLARV